MGIGMLGLLAVTIVIFVVGNLIDRKITRKRLEENQRLWDEYSKGMTYEEKCEVYFEWCTLRKIESGWSYFYFPRL